MSDPSRARDGATSRSRSVGPPPGIDALTRRADEIDAISRRHRARGLRVVGSVARGEAGPGSDLDLLVDFEDDASLLDIVALEGALSDLLGCRVDMLDEGAFEPATRVVGPDNPARRERIRQALEREAHALR